MKRQRRGCVNVRAHLVAVTVVDGEENELFGIGKTSDEMHSHVPNKISNE